MHDRHHQNIITQHNLCFLEVALSGTVVGRDELVQSFATTPIRQAIGAVTIGPMMRVVGSQSQPAQHAVWHCDSAADVPPGMGQDDSLLDNGPNEQNNALNGSDSDLVGDETNLRVPWQHHLKDQRAAYSVSHGVVARWAWLFSTHPQNEAGFAHLSVACQISEEGYQTRDQFQPQKRDSSFWSNNCVQHRKLLESDEVTMVELNKQTAVYVVKKRINSRVHVICLTRQATFLIVSAIFFIGYVKFIPRCLGIH